MSCGFEFVKHFDGVGNAAFDDVVSIDEQQAGVGESIRIRLERRILVLKTHDETVRMGTGYGNAVQHAGQHVGSGRTAADHCRPCTVDAGVRSLRAAKSEFHDLSRPCGVADFGGFGRDQRLVIDDIEQRRFDELRFANGRDDGENGFLREDKSAFLYRGDGARKTEVFQKRKKFFVKQTQRTQIRDLLFPEMQVVNVVDRLLQARRNRVSDHAVCAVKNVENRGFFMLAQFKIAVHHRQLVQVGHQSQISHNVLFLVLFQ